MKKLLLLFAAFVLISEAQAQKTIKLFVAEQTVMCPGNYSADCMLIKEKKKSEWSPTYTDIENFTYLPGYEYTLKVRKNETGTPYTLIKVLKKKQTAYNPADRLGNIRWYLHSMHEDTIYMNLLDTTKVYIELNANDKRLSGKGICNRFSGEFTVTGTDLTVGSLASTKMACEGNILEGIVTNMLQKMKHYTVVGNTLTLKGDNKEKMVFKVHRDAPKGD